MLRLSSKKRILSLLVMISVVVSCMVCATEVSHAGSNFVTKEYNVTIDVHEDNSASVTEEITIDALYYMHGIYRYIPMRGTAYLEIDNEVRSIDRAMNISNIDVESYVYETSNENGNKVIRIGSPNYEIIGTQTYVIKYDCTMYEDGISEKDFFYFNCIPHGWETSIEQAKVTINMPSEFDSEKAWNYKGKYGSPDRAPVYMVVNGNSISIEASNLAAGEGITMQIDLPEGYFTGVKSTAWMDIATYVITIAAVLLAAALWFIYGRDPLVVESVEFYPPDDITPSEAGFIIDGIADRKDIVAMIIWLADKGYLTIEEKKVQAEGLVGKLLDREETEFFLTKKKNYYGDKFFVKTVFDGLFLGRKTVSLSELKEDFYYSYELAVKELRAYHRDEPSRQLFTASSNVSRILAVVLSAVPFAATVVFNTLKTHSDSLMIVPALVIATIFAASIMVTAYDRKYSYALNKRLFLYFAGAMIFVLAAIVTSISCYPALPVVPVIATCIIILFASIMKKRTDENAKILGRLLGFKDFIRVAELEKINMIVNDDPEYFYRTLPYAYVFGLTDEWAGKFESIALEPPAWYRGYYYDSFDTYIFMSSFNRYVDSVSHTIAVPAADSDGSGFGGGSFGGGGGFSGGGFGGGGGGGW